ncbi:MAG: carbohydrate ABC transporter permease, partial [Pseudomonadota bacterium]
MAAVSQESKFSKLFWPVVAWVVALVFFFPIFWMILTSFK